MENDLPITREIQSDIHRCPACKRCDTTLIEELAKLHRVTSSSGYVTVRSRCNKCGLTMEVS